MSAILPYVLSPVSLPSARPAQVARTAQSLKPAQPDQVQFSSGNKRVFASNPFPLPRTENLRFGALRLYDGPFNTVRLITDFNDGTSNAEAERLFQDVLKFTEDKLYDDGIVAGLTKHVDFLRASAKVPGILQTQVIQDIPDRNRDFAALSLLRLGGGRPNNDIFVHVADPGVGDPSTRTILKTEKHGIYIGPNNGTLGLLIQQLKQNGEQYELRQIDFDKVAELERIRLNDPEYKIPPTFHGRDVFVVVAGAIAGGLDPLKLGKPNSVEPIFSNSFQPKALPVSNLELPLKFNAVRDNTAGNLKLDLTLTQEQFNQLAQTGASFRIANARTGEKLDIPVKNTFSEVDQGEPLLYLGSTWAPDGKSRFLELAINHGDVSKALNVDGKNGAKALVILPSV